MAHHVNFSASPRLLGIVQLVFPESASPVGRRLFNRSAIVDSGRRYRALHHGSVFESAESSRVRGHIHDSENAREEILAGWVVAGICRVHASVDVGLSLFVLSSVRVDGFCGHRKSWKLVDAAECCRSRGSGLVGHSAGAGAVGCVSRSGEKARQSLHPELGLVRVIGDRCSTGIVLVVWTDSARPQVASG